MGKGRHMRGILRYRVSRWKGRQRILLGMMVSRTNISVRCCMICWRRMMYRRGRVWYSMIYWMCMGGCSIVYLRSRRWCINRYWWRIVMGRMYMGWRCRGWSGRGRCSSIVWNMLGRGRSRSTNMMFVMC